ncbi:MAG TPA: RNase H family protein [Steroidobacteraceae bacterium]|jgi:ribonuclease HI
MTLMTYENALNIYVDGSSYSHPRRGGIGVRYVTIDAKGNEVVQNDEMQGHEGATNNEMELLACIKGLDGANDHPDINAVERVYVLTDSMYVTSNLGRAKFEWPKRKWLTRDGRPVENSDLWKELLRALRKIRKRVEFEWVKGHSKDQHNKAVDKLAKQSAKGVLKKPLKVITVRRKKSSATVIRGCVPMRGQEMAIRIITDTYMRVQRLYKYKYEVLADACETHSAKVDWIYHQSEECLRAGHHYEVEVNHETNNPRIVQVIRELARD